MMPSLNDTLRTVVPAGWSDVIIRTLKVEVVAFGALVLKEWLDTHEWDIAACAIDGSWVAGGVFVLNALLLLLAPRRNRIRQD